jgi:2-keto-4-pentenoate hydratase
MQPTAFDPSVTAMQLLQSLRNRTLLERLPADTRPTTLEQGYVAQDAFFEAAGGTCGGWKLGAGSPAAMRAANLSRPLVGQLDQARLHGSGAHLQLDPAAPITIECEVGFILERDLPPDPGRTINAADIRATCVTFEVVRSRFIDRKSVGWPSFVADNVGFEALIVGDTFCSGLDEALLHELADTVVVDLDGQPRARSLTGEAATDPLNSLKALYAHAAERGVTLRAGDIVSTGAMCEPFDIVGTGHELSVRYFGKVLRFTV